MKVVRARRSGYAYPYEIIKMLVGDGEVTDVQDFQNPILQMVPFKSMI